MGHKLVLMLVIVILMISGLLYTVFLVPKSTNIKAESTWKQSSYSDFNNGTLNNTTIIGKGEEAELSIDLLGKQTWTLKTPASPPSPRKLFAMAPIYGTNKVLLFSGCSETWGGYDDTWVFNLDNLTWTKKNPDAHPIKRLSHAMASINGDDKVVLFGGSNGGPGGLYAYFNDTWVYDLSKDTWINKNPSSHPSKRFGHAMASIDSEKKVVLFGGSLDGSTLHYDETWVYDLTDDNIWTQFYSPIKPVGRVGHSMAPIYGTDKILLFGGANLSFFPRVVYNDTWIYDMSNNEWTKKSPPIFPNGRHSSAMAPIYGTDKVILFGGTSDTSFDYVHISSYFNDTWIYDLSTDTWTQNEMTIKPLNRCMHAMASLYGKNVVLLFGGDNPPQGGQRCLNDTWIYKYNLTPQNGSYISAPYHINGYPRFRLISCSSKVPSNTSIKLQLRSATNLSNLLDTSFVGPNGTPNNYYTTFPSKIWSGHSGDRWLQTIAYLNMSIPTDSPILKNIIITYNCLPMTKLITPGNGSILNINQPIFKWNYKDIDSVSQLAFQVLISNNHSFDKILFDCGEQYTSNQSWQFPNTILGEGKWYWKVRTKDSDGDWGFYSSVYEFTIDSEVPKSIINEPKNNSFYNSLNTIFGKAYDPPSGLGLKRIQITIQNLNENKYWDGFKWNEYETFSKANGTTNWKYDTSAIFWNSGNKYIIQSQATDNASNIEKPTFGKIFIFDNENVKFSNSKPPLNFESPTNEVEVGITISDMASGVNASTIEYSVSTNAGESWSSWASIYGYQNAMHIDVILNLTFPNGTANRIKWRASDIVGNGPKESEAYPIRVNTWQPTFIPLVTLLSPSDGTVLLSTSVELYWQLENQNLLNISYDIYLDTINPPIELRYWNFTTTNLTITGLSERVTYYWTVIPKIGITNGTCRSGIWAFTINTSLPSPIIKLISPKNGAIVYSNPTLSWLVDYEGTETLAYDVYISGGKEIIYNKHPSTNFIIKEILEDGKKYYWHVIPWAGSVRGSPSEIWSFTIKKNYIPRFEINLTVSPPVVYLAPKNMTQAKAIVTNQGEVMDFITVAIEIPPEACVDAIVNVPSRRDISPGGTAVFNITITTAEDIEKGEVILTVVATSTRATKYDKIVEESAELIVKIITEKQQKEDYSSDIIEYWIISLIIIIILIIILIVAIVMKQKKRFDQMQKQEKPAPEDTLKVKPNIISKTVISVGELQATPTLAQLPNTTTNTITTVESKSQQTIEATSKIPQLVNSTRPGQVPTIQRMLQAPQQPQLPPAQKSYETKSGTGETTPIPTIISPSPAPTIYAHQETLKVTTLQNINLD